MDVLIAVDFIKKFATKKEAKYAANLMDSFIKERSKIYDYYCIFLNSVAEKKVIDDGTCWNPAILGCPDASMHKAFDQFFFSPIPNLSLCFRQNLNPYVASNPPISVIMDAIKGSGSKVRRISILPSSGAQDALIIKESIVENFEIDADRVSILDLATMMKLSSIVKKIN